jgi:HEAT repeat protein
MLTLAGLCLSPVASRAAESLGELLDQLEHSREVAVRLHAAEALPQYGERAVPSLRGLLHHGDPRVRDYACLALVRLGPRAEAAVPDLIAIVGNPAEPNHLRGTAIMALAQIGPAASSALPVLRAVIDEHPSLGWRREVVSALAAFATPEAVAVLIKLLERGERQEQLVILAAFGHQGEKAKSAASELLSFAGRSPDRELGDRVFLTVATFGRDAIGDLVPYLQSDRLETRRRTALALSRLGPDAADAVPMLCETVNDEETLMRFWAAKALGNVGPAARPAAESLRRLFDDADPNVRWEATNAIAKIDLAAITQDDRNRLLADPDPGVRQRAAMICFANR